MSNGSLFKSAFIWGVGATVGSIVTNTIAKILTPPVEALTKKLQDKKSDQ